MPEVPLSKTQAAFLPNAIQRDRIPLGDDVMEMVRPMQRQQQDLRAQMYTGVAALLLPPEKDTPSWRDIAHEFQLPPAGNWTVWLLVAGRGSGKTRAAAETITDQIVSGMAKIIGLIGPTAGDVRDVMVEGPAGLLRVAEARGITAYYQPSRRRVVWPDYKATATLFSAEEPRRLRGPQHDLIWCEEVAAWQDAWQGDVEETAWNNAMFGLRLGQNPQAIVTTTPKANKLTKQLIRRVDEDDAYVMTTGSTYANRQNLAPTFFKSIISRYEGTRLGRQEILGQMLEDVEGALWTRDWIDRARIARGDWYPQWRASFSREEPEQPRRMKLPHNLFLPTPEMRAEREAYENRPFPIPHLVRLVVAVDPNTTSNPNADEAGVVIAARGDDGRAYVLDDRSVFAGPTEWSRLSVEAYREWLADKIVAERNNGGEMVKITIRQIDEHAPVELVWASRGKVTRAEPVASLYEQGKVSHVGEFSEMEDQLCSYVPGSDVSPGRLDALVWALTNLFDLTPDGPDQRSRKLMVVD